MRRAAVGLVAVLALGPTALGCDHGADERETASILEQIDRLRATDPADREAVLTALENARPKNVLAEQARLHCAAAYRALLENLRQTDRLKQMVKAATSDAGPRPAETAVARDLDAAEKTLDTANQEMPRCEQATAALRSAPPR